MLKQIKKFISKNRIFFLLLILTIPTFYRMLRVGIFSTQDFHFFRLVEFNKCIKDFQIPCRWAPDAGLGYGEPLFNFYGQLVYGVGEVFHLIGFSLLSSFKLLFVLSLIISAIGMYLLAKHFWKSETAAFLAAAFYLYAPYRAVDVWVRGALPEAMGFAIFPFLFLELELFIQKEKRKHLLLFAILLTVLILTHNLSVVLFLPILLIWVPYRLTEKKKWYLVKKLLLAFIFSILISSFYLFPTVFEAGYVNLDSTIRGYFDFRGHFATISQLLFSRYWGYGGSVFGPEDGLNISVGIFQWIVPLIAGSLLLFRKKLSKHKDLLILIFIGWICLFLTHNKSTLLWEGIKPLAFVQFPWRFLSPAVFIFSLASGGIIIALKRTKLVLPVVLLVGVVLFNFSFFREDLWYKHKDQDLLSGLLWEDQTRASMGDYWPNYGKVMPVNYAEDNPVSGKLIEKTSNSAIYETTLDVETEVMFPINYFPGWEASIEGEKTETYPKEGLITTLLPEGEHTITLSFRNTPVRTIGNILSVVFLGIWIFLYKKTKRK